MSRIVSFGSSTEENQLEQLLEMGPGYRVAVKYDRCGCTRTFHFERFTGLRRYTEGDVVVEEFSGFKLDRLGVTDVTADLPEGVESTYATAGRTDTHYVARENLETWLREQIAPHARRMLPEDETTWSDDDRATLEAFVEGEVDEISGGVRAIEARIDNPPPDALLEALFRGGRLIVLV